MLNKVEEFKVEKKKTLLDKRLEIIDVIKYNGLNYLHFYKNISFSVPEKELRYKKELKKLLYVLREIKKYPKIMSIELEKYEVSEYQKFYNYKVFSIEFNIDNFSKVKFYIEKTHYKKNVHIVDLVSRRIKKEIDFIENHLKEWEEEI